MASTAEAGDKEGRNHQSPPAPVQEKDAALKKPNLGDLKEITEEELLCYKDYCKVYYTNIILSNQVCGLWGDCDSSSCC